VQDIKTYEAPGVEVVETPAPIEVPGVVPGVTVAVEDGATTVAVPEAEVVVVPGDEGVLEVPGETVAPPVEDVAGAPLEALELPVRQSVVPPWRTGKIPDLALAPCESRSWNTNLVPGWKEGFQVN
jgi:hypothetical protein